MEKTKCNNCGTEFLHEKRFRRFCSNKCATRFHQRLRRPEHISTRYTLKAAQKKKANKIDKSLQKEIIDFYKEIKRKCLYLDAIDAFKLTHYYVELYGVWYFNEVSDVESELCVYYKKLEEYIKKLKKI